MQKFHSFQLPKVTRQQNLHPEVQNLNQHAAEESLFEISKLDEHRIHYRENILRDLSRQATNLKRYQKSSLSVSKKKEVQQVPALDLRTFRQTFLQHNNNFESLGLTSFVIIDNRKARRNHSKQAQPKSERGSLHQQINRKAKYLFRTRNKSKKHPQNESLFGQSFYCSKIHSAAADEN